MSSGQIKALSITTRGIGLSTCNLCFMSANVANINPPMYAMYRVFLGLVEAKLSSIKQSSYFVKELCYVYDYLVKPHMLETPLDVVLIPEPIKRIIDAVDVITHNNVQYIPVVAAQVYDEEGRLVPRPENILLSNLRDVVIALSSEDTPVKYRIAFKEYCSIPGAIWNDNNLLMNANEIIPEDYNLEESLLNDMWPLYAYLIRMQKEFPNIAKGVISDISPKLSGSINTSINGSKAAFLSRDMSWGKLHASFRNVGESLEGYIKRCNPQVGSARTGEFNVIKKMVLTHNECQDGQVALLGEYPNEKMLGQIPMLNLYSLRLQNKDSVFGEYINAVMASNEAIFSSVNGPVSPTTPTYSHQKPMSKLERARKQYQ